MLALRKRNTLQWNRWKRPVILVLGAAVIIAAARKGYGAYQAHLSSDLRRTLTAALGPGANIADVAKYRDAASLAVHTEKDREIEAKFDRLIDLMAANCDTEQAAMKSARKAATDSLEAVSTGRDVTSQVDRSEIQGMDAAVDNADDAFRKYLSCEARINRDRKTLPSLLDELGAALSLPPAKVIPLPSATPN